VEPYRGVEPRCFARKANVFPLDQYGTEGPAGIEPACAGFRPAANPSQLETRGRDPRSRTAFLLNPNQADYRLPRSREVLRPGARLALAFTPAFEPGSRARSRGTLGAARWRWRESNPLRRRLQGVSAASAVIPMGDAAPGRALPAASPRSGRHGGPPVMVLTLLTCQQASTFTLRWCSAGTAGVEPAFRSGWSRAAYPLADPQEMKTAPRVSRGRLPSRGLMA
jgi:hypothetical protein